MSNVITIRDIGPHTELEIKIAPGVVLLRGENQAGKSLAIRAVSALANGNGKDLPVRDGCPVGIVHGFGTTLTIGTRTQRAGELTDVEPLSDRLDLADLIDGGGFKDPEACTRRRIQALLSLTGTKVNWSDFRRILPEDRQHEITEDLADEDPVTCAGKVKRAMEKEARRHKDLAAKVAATAAAQRASCEGIDLSAELDHEQIREHLQEMVSRKAKLEEQSDAATASKSRYDDARAKLDALGDPAESLATAEAELKTRLSERDQADRDLNALMKQWEELRQKIERQRGAAERCAKALADQQAIVAQAKQQVQAVDSLRQIVESGEPQFPRREDYDAAVAAVREAEEALGNAKLQQKAREAKARAEALDGERAALEAVERIYRDAAHSTDTVLAEAVQSQHFSVREGELTALDRHGVERPYSQLSEGARAKIAILAAAEAVRADGDLVLVTLRQEAWDGWSTEYRRLVAQHAREHNVAIVTGEVADCPLEVSYFEAEEVAA